MKNYRILKGLCKKIFLIGTGNFWYEDDVIGDDNSISYKMLKYILFSIYGFMTLLEIMAALIGDFPEDEKSDSVTFAVSHTIVMIKIFSVLSNKELVKKLISDLIKVCEVHEDEIIMKEKYRIIKINVTAYFVVVYGSAACFVFEGLRKVFEGSHFVTIVTYYPHFEDNSMLATFVRVFMTIVLFILMLTMIMSVDGFTVVILIIFKYKFITLRNYFEKLSDGFEKALKKENSTIAADKLTKGLIEGIKMHKELLRLSKEIDKAFGTVMALQLCQSSGSAVSLLLQIALSDQLTFVAGMKICFFVVALFFLLGLFLCNAGEITYQASLLSSSIFYCGWHLCPSQFPQQRNLGILVLLASAQAQRPQVMKAFKMLELTYGTFLLVIRGTYSVFALFYAQNQ
ncbi:uncharacterized protein LOC113398585 [Vanessa tameamea]|uniref:Odorant receptor n=1 Tax=Vanessa tameamea TaxID=334116 RepID=A0A8B8IAB4_VANTA|nr:uncharacterized protein LOC113398585 [Vanessa tameamea]